MQSELWHHRARWQPRSCHWAILNAQEAAMWCPALQLAQLSILKDSGFNRNRNTINSKTQHHQIVGLHFFVKNSSFCSAWYRQNTGQEVQQMLLQHFPTNSPVESFFFYSVPFRVVSLWSHPASKLTVAHEQPGPQGKFGIHGPFCS